MKLRAEDSVVSVLSVTGITHQSFTRLAAFVCFMQTKSLETKDFNELLVEKSLFLCAIYLSGAASSLLPSPAVMVCMGTVPPDPRPVTRLSRIIPVVSDILVTAMCAPAGQDDGS